MSDSLPSTTFEHSLLGIPPELRIHIYRFVLVDSKRIELNPYNPAWAHEGPPFVHYKIPSLLQVCHAIRIEALSLFHEENKFTLRIPAESVSRYVSWLNISEMHAAADCIPRIVGWFSYDNLLPWLEAYHAGARLSVPTWPFGYDASHYTDRASFQQLYYIIEKLRDHRGLNWPATARVLNEKYRQWIVDVVLNSESDGT